MYNIYERCSIVHSLFCRVYVAKILFYSFYMNAQPSIYTRVLAHLYTHTHTHVNKSTIISKQRHFQRAKILHIGDSISSVFFTTPYIHIREWKCCAWNLKYIIVHTNVVKFVHVKTIIYVNAHTCILMERNEKCAQMYKYYKL